MKHLLFALLCITSQLSASPQDSLALTTVKGITDKMLEFISCDIDEVKDWDEYRNLFLPTAQKLSIRKSPDGKARTRAMNLEEFVRLAGPSYPREGFEEYAIGLTINEFNGIANVFQAFYCKNMKGTYEARGINSFQLVYLDDRWWISSTLFTNETEDLPLPDEFLFEEYRMGMKK